MLSPIVRTRAFTRPSGKTHPAVHAAAPFWTESVSQKTLCILEHTKGYRNGGGSLLIRSSQRLELLLYLPVIHGIV